MRPSSLKYGLIFLTFSTVAMIGMASVRSPLTLGLLGWFAAAFALVAAAYLFRCPWVLGKRSDGRIWSLSRIVLLPYHLLIELSFRLATRSMASRPWVEVVPSLYWGRRLSSREAEALPVTQVLDLTSEFVASLDFRQRKLQTVPMLDGTAPSLDQLLAAVERLRQSLMQGSTYLHCAMGHGRSGTVLIAYLLTVGRIQTVDEGVALLSSLRPSFNLGSGQMLLLSAWAEDQDR